MAAEGAVGRAEGGPLGGSHRKDPSSSAMQHHGKGLPDGLCRGPVPSPEPPAPRRAFVPRPRGAELDLPSLRLPGAGGAAGLVTEDPTGVPHTEDAEQSPQGPRAPPVWRRNKGRGALWGSGHRGCGVGEGRHLLHAQHPRPGTAVSPGAWGCQGPLAVPPVSGRGGLPCTPPMKLPQTQKVCPGDETSPAKASCTSPAGHTRPGDTAPTLAHAFELHTLCSWTQSIAPRSAAGRWQGLQRAPGLLGVEALLCARTPALGVGSSSPRRRSSRHLPGRQPHPGSITEGQVLTE